MMLSLVIGLIVIGSAFALYLGGKQTARISRELTATQDAGRLILDVIARELRSAGDFGCPPAQLRISTLAQPNRLNLALPPLLGFEAGTSPSGVGRLGVASAIGAQPLSDGLSISAVSGTSVPIIVQAAASTDSLTVRSTDGFLAGDIAVVADCLAASVFEVTAINQVANGTLLSHIARVAAGGSASGGNTTDDIETSFRSGSEVGRLDTSWWFVAMPVGRPRGLYRMSGATGIASLVSDRVRDLKFTYGIDTTGDGLPDQLNIQASSVTDWAQVVNVRLELLLRSENQVNEIPTPYFFNGVNVTPTDRYVYLPVEITSKVRNR